MFQWNFTPKKSLWVILSFTLILFPLHSNARDLYFENNEVQITGGANHVIVGNAPEDKRFTGKIFCDLWEMESLPTTTTLTVNLRRFGSIVKQEQVTYSTTDWVRVGTTNSYSILLKYSSGFPPQFFDYHFPMPALGSFPNQLRTGSYDFEFTLTSSAADHVPGNNSYITSSFGYTVYSGRLIVNDETRLVSSLTPDTSSMCNGDRYFSELSGNWTAQWWDGLFFTSSLCANIKANVDKYSSDISISRDVSLSLPFVVTGDRWVIKGQNPADLELLPVSIECEGSPPKTITLDTRLLSSTMTPNHVVTIYPSKVVTPNWRINYSTNTYYYEFVSSYQLPSDGPTIDDLQSGPFSFTSTISVEADADSSNNEDNVDFNYSVYSGLLYFNEVETSFTSLAFHPTEVCNDGGTESSRIINVTGIWEDLGTYPILTADFCASEAPNPDNYSSDLHVFEGQALLGAGSTVMNGLDIVFTDIVLDQNGGDFSTAILDLPEDVTAHFSADGRITPRGESQITFPGKSFSQTMEDSSLSTYVPYLHGYGMPFYVESSIVRLSLSSSTPTIALVLPRSVYVHNEAVMALAPADTRTSFPSNDIIFHQHRLSDLNIITVDQNGLSGRLFFEGDSSNTLETAFPKGRLSFDYIGLGLQDNAIDSGGIINPTLTMEFGRGCGGIKCDGPEDNNRWYQVAAPTASISPTGAFGGLFSDIGPSMDRDLKDTGEDSVEWGIFPLMRDNGSLLQLPGTYIRQDRGRKGAFVVSGFLMEDTADTLSAPYRLGQILLGSYLFNATAELVDFFPLHDTVNLEATKGNGMFPGINLGPEIYTPKPSEGAGQTLKNQTLVRFYDAQDINPSVSMADLDAVKYVLRPGGLTGVFNTGFDSSGGSVDIYDYSLNFDRFAFRQDRNILDGNTFIDGSLTLTEGPVANGVKGNQTDFDVVFVNLDLTCDGNLGAGQVDTEPEPDWPVCKEGTGLHKGCQTLVYWNMPVLLTGMAFDSVGDPPDGECATENRQLFLHSQNQIDGLGRPLTLAGFYSPKGVLHHQEFYGTVRTWFDREPSDESVPGFGIRLRNAFVNEPSVDTNGNALLPPWSGFSVLAGFTDVPLFDDVLLAGHFDNIVAGDRQAYDLYIFKDETDSDIDRDGVPDSYLGETVESLRQMLLSDKPAAPKPFFSYSWPTEDMVNLDYFATYQRATNSRSPQFNGLSDSADIMGVVSLSSVPDFITPTKASLSFGVSAEVADLANFQLDLANYSSGGDLDRFLQSLGVPMGTVQDLLCTPEDICLHTLEKEMLDLTGGDLTAAIATAVDDLMTQTDSAPLQGLPLAIQNAAAQLTAAYQGHSQIAGLLIEPLRDINDDMQTILTAEFTSEILSLYSEDYLAAIAVYGTFTTDPPPTGTIAEMEAAVEGFRLKLDRLIVLLDRGVTALTNGRNSLLEPDEGVIAQLQMATVVATDTLTALVDELSSTDLSNLLTDSDLEVNVLLKEVDKGSQVVLDVRNAIGNVDLGTFGRILQGVAVTSGAAIDTSLLDDAERTVNSSLAELDRSLQQADQALAEGYAALSASLEQMLNQLPSFFDDTSQLQQNLVAIDLKLNTLKDRIRYNPALAQLEDLRDALSALRGKINGDAVIPDYITDWANAQTHAQTLLDREAGVFAASIQASIVALAMTIPESIDLPALTFNDLFVSQQFGLKLFCDAAFTDLLNIEATNTLLDLLTQLQEIPSTSLPQPSAEDIRNLIRNSILESEAVAGLNTLFFAQFGLLSDQLDSISTQLTGRVNDLIRQTINSVNEALADQLSGVVASVGGWGNTIQSVGIDGYAIVSQDELERIHLDADFVFAGYPDSTSYNAALDVTAFQDNNGPTGCGGGESGTYYSVTLSTHDVSTDMLGSSVAIKEALLGFTINQEAQPVGVFGRCYLDGEIGFESMVLEDLGLEAGIGTLQTYLGATGAGHFDTYQIPKAAFYLGKSCPSDRLGVLGRLDPDVAQFIGPEISPLYGLYLRGATDIPVWDNGCALTIGAGADLGVWAFTKPGHGTLGGLIGGSLYGRLGCLAALKGKMTCLGQVSGSELFFDGSGWVGAGVGDCSPGSWQSISDVRRDKWCETADASFGVTYDNGFDLNSYTYNCCD